MSSVPWEEVEVPRGSYIGWGDRPGQVVTGKVLSYTAAGGTDANGNPCPQLSLELIGPADSWSEKGTVHSTIASGELVVINAGGVSLKRAVIAAQVNPGDLIKLDFASTVKVDKGTVKEFKVAVARGTGAAAAAPAARAAAPAAAPANGRDPWATPTSEEPPF